MPNPRRVPMRYLPKTLTRADKRTQYNRLNRSKKLYKNHIYYNRPPIKSFKSKPSKHIAHARKIYGVETIAPSPELSKATGCSIDALDKIVKKGEGAYYSSGSRPNQTPQSWGYARLASSITSGKSAAVDYDILYEGCNHKKRAFLLANKSRRKYKYGHSRTKKVAVPAAPGA